MIILKGLGANASLAPRPRHPVSEDKFDIQQLWISEQECTRDPELEKEIVIQILSSPRAHAALVWHSY